MTETAIQALPRRIRLRLDQTLAQWRYWQCDPPLDSRPEAAGVLGRGISNFSVLVDAGLRFVVRIDGIDPAANGLHRQLEWRALQAASLARLAPAPRYFNPELGSLVCDYLPPDPVQSQAPAEVGELLGRIHRLPRLHHRLDLAERIIRLEKTLAQRGEAIPHLMAGLRGRVFSLLDTLRSQEQSITLCHNDLLAANRLRSGGMLWALDWEYCAMGSPWYDLAVVTCGDSLGEAETTDLVQACLGRPPRAEDLARLADYCRVYRYLELLWYLALRKETEAGFVEQRAAALADAWTAP